MELPSFTLDNLRQQTDLVVFMCRKCRLPLGDSSNCRSRIQDTNQDFLINAVSENVVIQGEKILNTYQDENDSVFQILQCKECESAIGRFYFSTAAGLDDCLEKFVLYNAGVTLYLLGSANIQMMTHSEAPITLEKSCEFEKEINKCKVVLEKLQKKVEAIESSLSL